MNKKAIETIKQGIVYEESGALIYSKHLESILQWTGLPEARKQDIHDKIDIILKETLHHRILLGEVVEELENKK